MRGLSALAAVVLLAGCGKFLPRMREIADFEIIRVIGIDASGGGVELTAVITRGAPGGADEPGGSSAEIISVSAPTAFEAARRMNIYTDRHKHYGYIEFILIGEAAARSGISGHLDFITREHEARGSACVFAVRGGSAKDLLRETASPERETADTLRYMENGIAALSDFGLLRLYELVDTLAGPRAPAAVPALTCVPAEHGKTAGAEQPDKIFIPAGYAVADASRLLGYIDADIARGYNVLTGGAYSAPFTVSDADGRRMSFAARSIRSRLEPIWNDGALTGLRHVIEVEAELAERHSRGEYSAGRLDELGARCAEVLRSEISAVVELSRELGDFLGAGTRVRMSAPVRWERIKDDWAAVYPALTADIDVTFRIDRTNRGEA